MKKLYVQSWSKEGSFGFSVKCTQIYYNCYQTYFTWWHQRYGC